MSDFPARSFKWTEMISILLENSLKKDSKLREQLDQLRQYATEKYKATNPVEERYLEYNKDNKYGDIYIFLVKMFGEP